jgi:hypothetical protein
VNVEWGDRRGSNPCDVQGSREVRDPRRVAFELLAHIRGLALDAGDLALAKRTHAWEGELLGEHDNGGGAEVIDLASRGTKA